MSSTTANAMAVHRHARGSDIDERPAQTNEKHVQTDFRVFGFISASQLRMTDLGEHSGQE